MTKIKICGVTTEDALNAAAGADFVGFVFYPKSPRALDVAAAATLSATAEPHLKKTGLFVDPDDAFLERVLSTVELNLIQLHGEETPQRVRDIAGRFGLPVMKALRVADESDVRKARRYEEAAKWLLFDAKIEGQAGGTGKTFDWTLLKDFKSPLPWMLSGGLNAANVGDALAVLKPNAVDVSSGVESAPGRKDPALIENFIKTVKGR